jgi:hypothetical protein
VAEVRNKLLEFLKALEVALPPEGGHHAITFCQYGSASTGWEDRLGLHVRLGESAMQTVFLEEGDLEKPVWLLIADVKRSLTAVPFDPPANSLYGQRDYFSEVVDVKKRLR